MSGILPRKTEVNADPTDRAFIDIAGDDASRVLSTLASATARRILARLYQSPGAASDLADHVDTSLQNVVYHLQALQEAGLVKVVGTWYSSKGRAMKVYAPVHEAMVLFAGDEGDIDLVRRDVETSR